MNDVALSKSPASAPGASRVWNAWFPWISLLLILTSMGAATVRLWNAAPLRSANDRSRWCTVWAIVERGTYQIDEIRQRPGWDTIDIVRHDGHFYSSKPPILPRIVAELYRGLNAATGWTLTEDTRKVTRTILFLINIVPMALALWAFAAIVRRYCTNAFGQLFLMAAACWGTMLNPYLTVFNNHTIAATCLIFALKLAIDIVAENRLQAWKFELCGVASAFAVCNELPAALFGLAIFGLLFRASWAKTLTWFVPGALIPLAFFFLTNYHATGGIKPFYAYYGTEKYEFVHEGVPSYWMEPKGIDRPRDPPLTYLLHCTIGHHGVFSLTPIWLLLLGVWLRPRDWKDSPLRPFIWLGLGLTMATLGFYLSRTSNYNYSGVTVALRWMLWLIPFWLISLIPAMNHWGHSKRFQTFSIVLLAASIFFAWTPPEAPWTQNWIYRWMEQARWIDYSDPRPQFDRPHSTWLSTLPEGALQPDYWIEFSSTNPDDVLETIRLQDGGPAPNDTRLLRVLRREAERTVADTTYVIAPAQLLAGAPVSEFLIGLEDGSPPSADDMRFFQGIPALSPYFSSRIRYEKSPLRVDAFRCHIGYAYVTVRDRESTDRQYVRDAWYCPEVPFGVLKWEDRVLDPRTKKLLSRRVWSPTAAGMLIEPVAGP